MTFPNAKRIAQHFDESGFDTQIVKKLDTDGFTSHQYGVLIQWGEQRNDECTRVLWDEQEAADATDEFSIPFFELPELISPLDRYQGALLGLAVGDALGTTLEFTSSRKLHHIDDMTGDGPFHLQPGQWTDDTSMALCLAESLITCGGFDPKDQMERYVRWFRTGHLSSTGACFDIGNTVRAALEKFESTAEPFCGFTDPQTAGNGSLMRLAPVPLYFPDDPIAAIEISGKSSSTTHGARAAVDACRYYGAILFGALNSEGKAELLSALYAPVAGYWDHFPLAPEITTIAMGSFKEKRREEIRASGYVAHTLEAALWAFYHSQSFEQGCLMAVNLGEDADTTGAVYGQLAGAFYGINGIPEQWREKIAKKELILEYAGKLLE